MKIYLIEDREGFNYGSEFIETLRDKKLMKAKLRALEKDRVDPDSRPYKLITYKRVEK